MLYPAYFIGYSERAGWGRRRDRSDDRPGEDRVDQLGIYTKRLGNPHKALSESVNTEPQDAALSSAKFEESTQKQPLRSPICGLSTLSETVNTRTTGRRAVMRQPKPSMRANFV